MCKKKIDNTDLNHLLKKAIEAKPEYVPPPRPFAIPERDQKFRYILPFYQRASFIFSLGLMIGVLLGKGL